VRLSVQSVSTGTYVSALSLPFTLTASPLIIPASTEHNERSNESVVNPVGIVSFLSFFLSAVASPLLRNNFVDI
jgi:hypothetical protein